MKFLASSISPVLNKLKVKVVSNDECQLSFGNIVHETTLCSIGTSDNTGTCQVRIFKKDNKFILLIIINLLYYPCNFLRVFIF